MPPYRPIFTLAGVPWTADRRSWQFVVPKLVIGLAVAFVFRRTEPVPQNILIGLLYGVLLNLVLALHIVGHIISSKWVAPPMTEARITPRLIETRYDHDPGTVAPRVHLARSLGGPAMNLLLGAAAFVIWQTTGHHVALFVAGASWVLMAVVLLPLPTVDGEVIWREIGRLLRRR